MARILIAEDDPQVRGMLRLMLEREGHAVLVAADGREALNCCAESQVDILITDIFMPEMEGVETIRILRRTHPEVKVIAISGGGSLGPDGYLDVASKMGASFAFTKPVDRATLLGAIRSLAA